MSDASECVAGALRSALRARSEFSGIDGLRAPTADGVLPQARVDDPQASDWGTKGTRGRELRTGISIRVARGQNMRLPALVAAAEAVGEALTGDLGGWRVASSVLLRSRSFDTNDGRAALIEHRVRVFEN